MPLTRELSFAAEIRRVFRQPPRMNDKQRVPTDGGQALMHSQFANHPSKIKDVGVVKRHGVRLMPELFEPLNPMPFDAAVIVKRDLAEDLRRQGTR